MNIYKSRSYAACLGEGFRFLAKNVVLITKVMLPWLMLSSLLTVVATAMTTKLNVAMLAGMRVEFSEFITAMSLTILSWIAYALATGRMFLLFRRLVGHELTADDDETINRTAAWITAVKRTVALAWRSAPYLVWCMIIGITYPLVIEYATGVLGGLETPYLILAIAVIFLLLLAVAICLSTFIYTYYCRMMQPTNVDASTEEGKALLERFYFRTALKKGFQHKGKIFGVAVLSGFILIIASIVLLLPAVVSVNAYFSSIEGAVNYGDEAIIPTSGFTLMLLASTASLVAIHILAFIYHTAMLYVHGDILKR